MQVLCSKCDAPMSCEPDGGCWCADLPRLLPVPARVPVPEEATKGCLCRSCLTGELELQKIVPAEDRHLLSS
jgi:hypothetical protein